MCDLFYQALKTNQDPLLTASVLSRISASFPAEFGRLTKHRNCLKRMVSHEGNQKVSQKEMVPVLAYARAPGWYRELFRGSPWLSH